MKENTELDRDSWKATIDKWDHEKMARMWRFGESGHPVFADKELFMYYNKRFSECGGMTTEMSKQIGLDPVRKKEL